MAYSHQREYQPLFILGKFPVWVTTIFTALFAAGIIATALLSSARVSVQPFAFTAPGFLSGALWQPLTYLFVDWPSFFSIFGLFIFYSIGIEFERYFARSGFLKLLALIAGTEMLGSLLIWWLAGYVVTPIGSRGEGLSGNYHLIVGMMVAFATLYPNIEYLGWIPLKWFVFACIVLGALMYFPERQWGALGVYLNCCLTGFLFVRHQSGALSIPIPRLPSFRKRPKLRVLPRSAPRAEIDVDEVEDSATSEVDALLDKIAKSGLASLSAAERAKLEKAREDLMKRETR